MNKNVALAVAVVMAVSAEVNAAIILPESDARVWQEVFDASAPLEWRWTEEAVGARLVISNLLSRQQMEAFVLRAGKDRYGAYSINYAAGAQASGEALYDIRLVQLADGEREIESQVARLAYLPGAFAVATEVGLPRVRGSRAVAYDAMWKDDTLGASAAGWAFAGESDKTSGERLTGVSGYFASPDENGRLSLEFDDVESWFGLIRQLGGLCITVK